MTVSDIPTDDLNEIVTQSLTSVFDTMLSYSCEYRAHEDVTGKSLESPGLGGQPLVTSHVGSVGLVGELNGVVYLYMKTPFVTKAAERITGLSGEDLGDDIVADVCGELTNVFGGGLKNALFDMGHNSMLTIPTVLSGDDLFLSTIGVRKHLRFDFTVDGEAVVADLVLAEPGA